MKRAEAQKAVDAGFADTVGGEYRNLLNDAFSEHPTETREQAFRKALAINIAAHRIASRAVAEAADLED